MISPNLVYFISPGSDDCASPISGPSHKAAPWCGQRFNRPKNSPLILKIAIGRSSMVRHLRVPGGSSSTEATTWRAMLILCKSVKLERVVQIKRFAIGLADAGRQYPRRLVKVPMRIIGGKQQSVPADPFDHVGQVVAPLRVLHRLRGPKDVVADIFR